MNFTNSRIDIYPTSDTTHAVVLKSNRLANKLNKYLNYYPDYTIKDGEQPVFKFDNKHLDMVVLLLGLDKVTNAK